MSNSYGLNRQVRTGGHIYPDISNNPQPSNVYFVEQDSFSNLPKTSFSPASTNRKKICLIAAITIAIIIILCVILVLFLWFFYIGKINNNTNSNNDYNSEYDQDINATCLNNSIKINNKCICPIGYNGDGVRYCDECGLTSYQQNVQRIVGGQDAVAHSWPSAALIIFSYKGDIYIPSIKKTVTISLKSKCGGTLLNRNTVLTASHCISKTVEFNYQGVSYETAVKPTSYYPTIESMYKVYLGLHDQSLLDFDAPLSPAVQMQVSKIFTHPNYNDESKLNDIAVLKLTESVILNKYIQISCLPLEESSNYPNSNIDSWSVGWGYLSYNGKPPAVLNNVKLRVYDSSMCKYVSTETSKNWNSQICAGYYDGGKDTCQGDSGGSLFIIDKVNEKTKYVSVGIVSYGVGCGEKYLPGVYTRISYYLKWIRRYL